jgi:hypothetical protein
VETMRRCFKGIFSFCINILKVFSPFISNLVSCIVNNQGQVKYITIKTVKFHDIKLVAKFKVRA